MYFWDVGRTKPVNVGEVRAWAWRWKGIQRLHLVDGPEDAPAPRWLYGQTVEGEWRRVFRRNRELGVSKSSRWRHAQKVSISG